MILEQKFADIAYKDFISLRYGLTSCCNLDLNKIAFEKEVYDWENLKVKEITESVVDVDYVSTILEC